MAKLIRIRPHLKLEEIEQRYRQSRGGVERSHWQIIWLVGQGKRSGEVAAITGYSGNWVRAIVRRYNTAGPGTLGDQRHRNPGCQRRLLTAEQEATLRAEVEADTGAGQPWNGPQVAARLSEMLGRPVHRARGWELLRRWGLKLKVPRPRHVKADPQVQQAFKKR